MKVLDFIHKIERKWTKIRLQPIRVFCFHQVSELYDSKLYCRPDWIPNSFIKSYIKQLQMEGYVFITLEEAQSHLEKDIIRRARYAVLTADDGLICQAELLPWLEDNHVPITLFVGLETLDGQTCTVPVKKYHGISDQSDEQRIATLLYLTKQKLQSLSSPLLSIGMHGIKHELLNNLSAEKFIKLTDECVKELSNHPKYIPFFAYPHGAHSQMTDRLLQSRNITPVYADGNMNYNDSTVIHREILEKIYECQNHQL